MLLQRSQGNGDSGVRQDGGFKEEIAGKCAGPPLPELGEWEKPQNESRERREETENECSSVRITEQSLSWIPQLIVGPLDNDFVWMVQRTKSKEKKEEGYRERNGNVIRPYHCSMISLYGFFTLLPEGKKRR